LWVASDLRYAAFSTDGSGDVTPLRTGGTFEFSDPPGISRPGITDIVIAYEGTQWVLERRDFVFGSDGWRLFAVAPGENTAENVYGAETGHPFGLAMAGDGMMVGTTDRNGVYTIATYAFAASNSAPIRTWTSSERLNAFAMGNDGRLYVAHAAGTVDVYDANSTGGWTLFRSITTEKPLLYAGQQGFAVGQNGSIYGIELDARNAAMYVNVFSPFTGKLTRRIGPVTYSTGAFLFPAITVDRLNRLYIATNGKFYRFGPKANGAATPQRVMTNPMNETPRALSVGPKL
jgi:hypothetical protein